MGRWSTRAVLLLLLIGQISAESSSPNCQHMNTLHERMDGVEKRLEDSVQMLQSEVSLLLAAVEGHERIPLLDTPAIDILEQPPPHNGHTG